MAVNPTPGQLRARKRALTAAWDRRARVDAGRGFTGGQDARLRGIGQALDRLARVSPRGLAQSTLQRGVPAGIKVLRRVDSADTRAAADFLRIGLAEKGHGSSVRQLAGGDLLVVADDNRAIRVRRKRNPRLGPAAPEADRRKLGELVKALTRAERVYSSRGGQATRRRIQALKYAIERRRTTWTGERPYPWNRVAALEKPWARRTPVKTPRGPNIKKATARARALAAAVTRAMHSKRSTPARLRALQAAAARAARVARMNPRRQRKARRVVTRTTTVRTVTNPRRKAKSMARRRRRSPSGRRRRTAKQRSAFKRMIAGLRRFRKRLGRKGARARKRRKSNPARRRRRRNPSALIVNPSRRRRRRTRSNPPMARKRRHRRRNPHGRRRRRRNPGMGGGIVKQLIATALPAAGVGAALGFMDTKILKDKKPIFGVLAKVGAGIGASLLLRKRPALALPIAGACFGTLGYQGGVKVAGGVVSSAPTDAAKELAEMAATDEETFGVLTESLEGMGVLSIEGYAEDAEDMFEGTSPLDFEPAFEGADGAY